MFDHMRLLGVGLGALLAGAGQAQVTLDGTLSRAGPLKGPNYQITPDLGCQVGGDSIALSLTATTVPAHGQSAPQATIPPPAASQIPVYQPPLRGAPASRTGGASRGEQDSGLILSVLAPENTGFTSRAQPTLYWYSSQSVATPLEFTLNDDQSIKPLVETKANVPRPGIHALRLGYTLKPDVEYQWAIAAVADPNQRASDVIASGTIQRVQPSAALAAQLNGTSKSRLPFLYAEAGFWYDAIATLSEQIDANPLDRDLREQRAALLDQVGLKAAAAYDRGVTP